MFSFKKCAKIFASAAFAVLVFSFNANAYDVKVGTVSSEGSLRLRSEASTKSDIITSLKPGTNVVVTDETEGWFEVMNNGVPGFVSSEYLSVSDSADFEIGCGIVTGTSVNIRSAADVSAPVLGQVKKLSSVDICGVENGWYKINHDDSTAYIYSEYVKLAHSSEGIASSLRNDIVEYAKTFLGVRYVYGCETPKGFDCSGFVKYVFKNFDIELTRTARSQASGADKISKSELLPGDLVFFSGRGYSVGHVGIYIGDGQFIHASSPGDYVKITDLSDSYYVNHYTSSGRVID